MSARTDFTHTSRFPNAEAEEQSLAWLCSIRLAHRRGVELPDFQGIDWPRFVDLAIRHRVVPLIWTNLCGRSDLPVPEWVISRLRELYQLNALVCLRLASHSASILDALGTAGIPAILLKGPSLAAAYYGSIADRHSSDVDVLIDPADLQRTDASLRNSAHLPISSRTHEFMAAPLSEDLDFVHHLSYLGPGGVPVELHVRLHPNPELLRVTVPELIADGQRAVLARRDVPVMADDVQFLFLATHGARHDWERLQWVCDIAVMADRAGADGVSRWLEVARRRGLVNPAVQALVMAHRLLGTPLPVAATQAYARSLRIRFMVRRTERVIFGEEVVRPEDAPGIHFGLRLYRLAMTSRPAYLWREAQRGAKSIISRLGASSSRSHLA